MSRPSFFGRGLGGLRAAFSLPGRRARDRAQPSGADRRGGGLGDGATGSGGPERGRPPFGTPNLFILGAGKCGTTSLWEVLGRHPDIAVTDPKEPTFFSRPFQMVRNPLDYFALFDPTARYRVDASHAYLSTPETAHILRLLFPEARFLVTLRQPEARAYSLYRDMRRWPGPRRRPLEPIERFRDALAAEEGRFADPAFAETCGQYFWNFMYVRSSLYDEQLARYFELFERDRFLVMTLAEIERQPGRTLRTIADFLGVDRAGFGEGFPRANAGPP